MQCISIVKLGMFFWKKFTFWYQIIATPHVLLHEFFMVHFSGSSKKLLKGMRYVLPVWKKKKKILVD